MAMMRRAVYAGNGGPILVESGAVPEPGPGEVRARVDRCGICGSDISMTSGHGYDFPAGGLGHEWTGEVVELGPGVTTLQVGDRVTTPAGGGCGTCTACKTEGGWRFCAQRRGNHMAFADYFVIAAHHAVRVPDELSDVDGCFIEPFAVGLNALRMCDFVPGQTVAVVGAGGSALAVVFWARRLGAGRIVVASGSAHRRAAAEAMGADEVAPYESIAERDADVAFECVGKPGLLERAAALVRPGGYVGSVGMCMEPESIVAAFWAVRGLKLVFPTAYRFEDLETTALALIDTEVRPHVVVSEVIGLEELPDRIAAIRRGDAVGKVHVDLSVGRSG